MTNFRRGAAVFLAAAFLAGAAFAADREFTLINVQQGSRVLWQPGPLIVKKGEKVKLTLVNEVPQDTIVHGFEITAFNVHADVSRGAPHTLEFLADKAGVFEMTCHDHPAHLKGQILVLE